MALPIAGLVSGLFGGGSSQSDTAAAAGPIAQTVNSATGAINLGSKYLGRGAVTASETQASGSAAITAAAPNNLPIYIAAGVGVLVLVLVLVTKK